MIEELIDEINHLQSAKRLLDDILRHYNEDSCEFIFQSDKEFKRVLKGLSPENQRLAKTDKERLADKIEKYQRASIKYDD